MNTCKSLFQAAIVFVPICFAQAATTLSVQGQWTIGYDINNVAHDPGYFGIAPSVLATTSFDEEVQTRLPTVGYQNQITYYTDFGNTQSSTLKSNTFTSSFEPLANARVTVEFSLFGVIGESPSQAMIFINGQRRDISNDGSFTDINLAMYRQTSFPDVPRFVSQAELDSVINQAFSGGLTWTLSGNSYTWMNGQQISAITMYGNATITQYSVSSPIPEVAPLFTLGCGLGGLAMARRRLTPRSS